MHLPISVDVVQSTMAGLVQKNVPLGDASP